MLRERTLPRTTATRTSSRPSPQCSGRLTRSGGGTETFAFNLRKESKVIIKEPNLEIDGTSDEEGKGSGQDSGSPDPGPDRRAVIRRRRASLAAFSDLAKSGLGLAEGSPSYLELSSVKANTREAYKLEVNSFLVKMRINPATSTDEIVDRALVASLLWDSIDLPYVPTVLRILRANPGAGGYIFPFRYPELRVAMQEASVKSQIPVVLPYQLRHSGPSWDRLRSHRSLAEVQRRGSWQSLASLRRYEKSGMVAKDFEKLGAKVREHLLRCQRHMQGILLEGRTPLEMQRT